MDAAADAEFSDFMQGRWAQLVRLGYGLTGDLGLAEDLAQTALARAYASWPRVRRAGDPDAYVRRIMINANHTRFRKRRVPEQLADIVPEPPSRIAGDPSDERLRAALDGVTPRPAPIPGVRRAGKSIRARRRVGLAAGAVATAAVFAAGAVAGPALLHRISRTSPTSPTHRPVITVHPPGAGAPPGEIAWGRVNGRHWQISTTRSWAITTEGAGMGGGPPPTVQRPDPITVSGIGAYYDVYYGAVLRDVTSVDVTLPGGEVLQARPAVVYGRRLVGFATPRHMPILRVAAYAGHRLLASANPFNGVDLPTWSVMLRPGQPVPARISKRLFVGKLRGAQHRVSVYVGPWGRCVVDNSPRDLSPTYFFCGTTVPGPARAAGRVAVPYSGDRLVFVVGALGGRRAARSDQRGRKPDPVAHDQPGHSEVLPRTLEPAAAGPRHGRPTTWADGGR